MEQLDILWQYQELDLQVDQYEDQKRSSQLRQKLLKLRDYLINRDKQLVKLDADAQKKNLYYEKVMEEYKSLQALINKRREKMEASEVTDLSELQKLISEGVNIQARIQRRQEELSKLITDLDDFQKKLDNILVRVAKAKKDYTSIKKDYDKEVEAIKQKQDQIKAKRDEIGKKVDKNLLAKYKKLKINRSPVIAIFENDQCSGCYMSLASLVAQNVKEKKSIIECENCGRLLYYRG
ncbi:MAG: C4-type zinc ribbon domain-containing protein [Caldicoprobacterales bacterium]